MTDFFGMSLFETVREFVHPVGMGRLDQSLPAGFVGLFGIQQDVECLQDVRTTLARQGARIRAGLRFRRSFSQNVERIGTHGFERLAQQFEMGCLFVPEPYQGIAIERAPLRTRCSVGR